MPFRRIADYYEKIRNSNQEKPFHELILQIGDKENMGAGSENGQLARQILDEYYHRFQERNPNLYVFSAHIHMDEATPHLHMENLICNDFCQEIQLGKRFKNNKEEW